jgi:hypothetical protein
MQLIVRQEDVSADIVESDTVGANSPYNEAAVTPSPVAAQQSGSDSLAQLTADGAEMLRNSHSIVRAAGY